MQAIELDVSDLAPPEPMEKIIFHLAKLANQHYLKVYHRRLPYPLFKVLVENGWQYYHQETKQGGYIIYIYRKNDAELFNKIIAKLS